MKNYKYVITLKHDNGKINIMTVASNKEEAKKIVCEAEKCPYNAIIKIKNLGVLK